MKAAAAASRFSPPWGGATSSMLARAAPQQGFASLAEIDAYAQELFQEQSATGSDPDSSLGPYVTSVLRETNPQTPVTQLAEYDSLRELIQEQCWVDSEQAGSLLDQIATAVRLKQVPSTTTAEPVVSPNAENTLIPGNLWGDETSNPTNATTAATTTTTPQVGTSAALPLHANAASFPSLGGASAVTPETQQEPQSNYYYNYSDPATAYPYLDEQAFESSVEILLSMNPDISEEAARTALQLVQGDINWGQYLVDLALTAPPVCRHLLHDGCYRSDCQFSHDIEGHTCVFWMRGRCGKGAACAFRHGFDEAALQAVLPPTVEETHEAAPVTADAAQSSDSPPLLDQEHDPPLPSLSANTTTTSSTTPQQSIWGRTSSSSFAQVASQGAPAASAFPSRSTTSTTNRSKTVPQNIRRVDIPQDLWHAHENRNASLFYINDPLERYYAVAATVRRQNVIDLHFQSTKTFGVVLETILPQKLQKHFQVWIVTGTGHHVGSRTHQKGGGALEGAVLQWLTDHEYRFARGRDKNNQGGALLVYA